MRDEATRIQHLLNEYKVHLPEPNGTGQFDVKCAISYFIKHLFNISCCVGSMRMACRIPQNNFSLRFKHYTGMSPASYISHHRIEAAKLLLSDERLKDVPVSEIGFAVGYERASTFTTMFTKKAGMSPGKWRHQQLKKRRKNRREK